MFHFIVDLEFCHNIFSLPRSLLIMFTFCAYTHTHTHTFLPLLSQISGEKAQTRLSRMRSLFILTIHTYTVYFLPLSSFHCFFLSSCSAHISVHCLFPIISSVPAELGAVFVISSRAVVDRICLPYAGPYATQPDRFK